MKINMCVLCIAMMIMMILICGSGCVAADDHSCIVCIVVLFVFAGDGLLLLLSYAQPSRAQLRAEFCRKPIRQITH